MISEKKLNIPIEDKRENDFSSNIDLKENPYSEKESQNKIGINP